jgi:hypothetical protein
MKIPGQLDCSSSLVLRTDCKVPTTIPELSAVDTPYGQISLEIEINLSPADTHHNFNAQSLVVLQLQSFHFILQPVDLQLS